MKNSFKILTNRRRNLVILAGLLVPTLAFAATRHQLTQRLRALQAQEVTVAGMVNTPIIGGIGEVGPAGAAGSVGAQGPQGPQGPTGAVGNTGPQGNQGPQGPVGRDSTWTGIPGQKGNTGPKGAQGPQGPQGIANVLQGSDGPQGVQGPAGDIGTAGLQGATGNPGPAGNPGSNGYTGPTYPIVFCDCLMYGSDFLLERNSVTAAGTDYIAQISSYYIGDYATTLAARQACQADMQGCGSGSNYKPSGSVKKNTTGTNTSKVKS